MRLVLRILLAMIAIALLAWFGGRCYLARSVAQYDGTIRTNVASPVEITFDARGVPQVWAKTDADAYFGIGWLHGSERLFQMELVRRLARGELSEVFGEAAYEMDEFQRQIGFARAVNQRQLSPTARALMQRYVDGINAAIAQDKLLPPEFVVLRLKPRPWTIEDGLAISHYQTWFSHQLMDQDRRYQQLIEKLGMTASALTRAGHPWSPPTVPPVVPPMQISTASNSWAVAASRSSTKAALHASDPHLSIDQVPGLWYLAGLHSEEGLDVVGVTYGGAPFVVMGHNRDIAFSFTVASIDLIDYYDDAPAGAVIREEIRVKGEAQPRVLEVRHGARGVMVDKTTSLRWAGFDFSPSGITEAALQLQKAKTFDEFRNSVTRFGALDANWIYSDRAGNIGYQLGAPVPLRDYDTYVRQKANDPRTVWRGYRALDDTPHALNPAQGFLASCNNQPTSGGDIPGFYDPYRIVRATALLQTKRTPADMHAMQLDLTSGLATRWRSLAAEGAKAAGLANESQTLAQWDGSMTADSKAAALFAAWWRRMPHAVFEDELAGDWNTGRVVLDEVLTTHSPVIDDKRTKAIETARDISARAMRDAVSIANGRTWGEACTLLVKHPLARVKILDRWLALNRGPFPNGGDPGTLNANFYSYDEKSQSFRTAIGPSMRFVLDWSNVDTFTLTGALGQSGNPFSPHYDDFLGMMLSGESWTVPFTKEKVYAGKASLLRLTP
ncbi:MAG TPA: penicillin acylase family protein [Thermoanaerobaculia bacterium]|jgi:penicillin amidase|nr:penicillin acylase family protein [Thermoanaerobaculia bacterium]